MKYPKENIEGAKQTGAFESKMDPKILSLDDEEKNRLSRDFSSLKSEMRSDTTEPTLKEPSHPSIDLPIDVPLSFFEKIFALILQVLGIKTVEQFKLSKLLKDVEKELALIKPSIFLANNRRITRVFAYKIHDLFLKLLWMKKLFDLTLNNAKEWQNINLPKTLVEKLFEKIAGLQSEEIDSYFSQEGLTRVIKQFDDPKLAMETIEKNLLNYLSSTNNALIEQINLLYTNMMYFKNLTEYDFIALFRRFDPSFEMGSAPTFNDIPGDALLSYLTGLEELLIYLDLKLNQSAIFLSLNKLASGIQTTEDSDPLAEMEMEPSPDALQEDTILQNLTSLSELLKEIMYKNYITLIIRMLKRNPTYQPSVLHHSYDLFQLYSETLKKRVLTTAKRIIKTHKQKDIEAHVHKIFSKLYWVGIYTQSVSDDLNRYQYPTFQYTHYLAVIYSFISLHYKEIMKNSINILLLNGVFSEKNFHKQLADTFYAMDKYIANFEEFNNELQANGVTGKKLLSFLNKKVSYHTENRKIVEKIIVSINGRAKDFCSQFYKLFNSFFQILTKVYKDIDAKPPKYVKNIRSIGGFKNLKFLQTIEKSHYILKNIKTTVHLLQD